MPCSKRSKSNYKAENVDSKLPTLTLMIREKASQSPKLRAKAAEARGLILFAYRMCETHMDNNCVLEHAIKMAYLELWECYCCLSKDKFQATKLQSHARRFFTFVQRIRKYRRENVADQTKAPQFFWRWHCRETTLQMLGHIAMKTLVVFSATWPK